MYLFWGASFLAVREVVAVAPPFLASGFRFVIAGTTLVIWSRFLGTVWPAPGELRSTAMLGLVMFSINYACLFWAEQTVASGYAAIIASTIPVWIFIGEWLILGTLKPNAMSIAGILLGISGVTLLVLPTGGSQLTFAAVALLVGAICWSGGTIWSRRLPLPRSRHASAGLQMAFGGAFQLVFAWVVGEYGGCRMP